MDTNRLEGTLQSGAGRVQAAVGDFVGDAHSQTEGRVRQVAGKAQQMYGSTLDQVRSSAETVSEAVTEQPLMALLVAGAAGFLLSMLIRRG